MLLIEKHRDILTQHGYVKLESRSSKYEVYYKDVNYFFLGSHGAIRYGKSKRVSESVSVVPKWFYTKFGV
jgi:hypothetical protein